MVVKTAIGFLNTEPDNQLIGTIQGALTSLTGNPNFPTTTPTLADMNAALAAFVTAVADAVNGGRELVSLKQAKRAELTALARQLASDLTIQSNGDMTKLISSGFPHQKPFRHKIGELPAPIVPRPKQGRVSGQLLASTRAVYGASSYNWRLALASAPTSYLQTTQTPGARVQFKGLTPGEAYLVTVNAVGAAGLSNWSGEAELMVV